MAQPRPLAHAPIIEALVDFRVDVPEGVTVARIDAALQQHDFGYQKAGPILRGNFGFVISPHDVQHESVVSSSAIIGTRLHSVDGRYVALFSTEGFTLSRLEPYQSWELLIEEARRIWREYTACVQPVRIHRTATRFINNLRLPLQPGERFDRFLLGLPDLPPPVPQAVVSFLQRFVVQDDATGATAIVTQALNEFPPGPPVPVFLDIDVYREASMDPAAEDVWNYLAALRDLKNRIFFGALTEEAIEVYA